jgi:hypothetical protein
LNHIAQVLAASFLAISCLAQQPDLGLTWESQIRPWVSGASRKQIPEAIVRFFPGGESREELFVIYMNPHGGFTIAFAKTREINAQAFSNIFIYDLHQTPPAIPVELKVIESNKRTGRALLSGAESFIQHKPHSWDLMAQMGHGGQIFVSIAGSSYLYQGPTDSRGGPAVAKAVSILAQMHILFSKTKATQVFEFPSVKQLTQWRFCRALIQGNEPLALYLLSIGADPNKDPRFPESPIEHAVRKGYKRLLRTLLNLGADPEVKSDEGLNLIEIARKTNNLWAIPILQDSIDSRK